MPKIQSIGYASIADLNGVFYVDGIKHMVKADKILIEDPDMMTRTADTEEIDHVPAVDEQTQTVETRGSSTTTSGKRYFDRKYQRGDYKIFARTLIIRHVIKGNYTNGRKYYKSLFKIQVHTSGQKKKALIGWNTYKDKFHIEDLMYRIVINGTEYALDEPLSTSSKSNAKEWSYVEALNDEPVIGETAAHPMPDNFKMVRFRVRSGSLGKCGLVTEYWPGRPVPVLPLSPCIK